MYVREPRMDRHIASNSVFGRAMRPRTYSYRSIVKVSTRLCGNYIWPGHPRYANPRGCIAPYHFCNIAFYSFPLMYVSVDAWCLLLGRRERRRSIDRMCNWYSQITSRTNRWIALSAHIRIKNTYVLYILQLIAWFLFRFLSKLYKFEITN